MTRADHCNNPASAAAAGVSGRGAVGDDPLDRPLVGITPDAPAPTSAPGEDAGTGSDTPPGVGPGDRPSRVESAPAYAAAVLQAGGLPVILPIEPALAEAMARRCDALVLTGGGDPVTEPFGQPTHPLSRRVHPRRQAFELALIAAADAQPGLPALGVCLGMQLMALAAGGRLDPYLPDTLSTAADHQHDRLHAVTVSADGARSLGVEPGYRGRVVSSHRQAVADAGRLVVAAAGDDGVIEAVADPARAFYLGVQWHPERAGQPPERVPQSAADRADDALSPGLFRRLVAAARAARSPA